MNAASVGIISMPTNGRPTRSVPRGASSVCDSSISAASISEKMRRQCSRNKAPSAVSVMLRVLRWRRRTPSRSSIAPPACPIADDDTPSCRPATVKLRASAACTKAFSDPRLSIVNLHFGHTSPISLELWPSFQTFGRAHLRSNAVTDRAALADRIGTSGRPGRREHRTQELRYECNAARKDDQRQSEGVRRAGGRRGICRFLSTRPPPRHGHVRSTVRGRGRSWRRLVLELLSWGSRRLPRANVSVFARRPVARLEVQRALSLLAGNPRVFPLRGRKTRPQSGHSLQQTRE